jgi:hypothetical protein
MKKCPTCREEFIDWPAVFAHQKTAHPPKPVEEVYPCKQCPGLTFSSFQALSDHESEVHPPPPKPVDYFDTLTRDIFVGEWYQNGKPCYVLNADGSGQTFQKKGKITLHATWEIKKGRWYKDYNNNKDHWRTIEVI